MEHGRVLDGNRRRKAYLVVAMVQASRVVHDPSSKILANAIPVHTGRNGVEFKGDGESAIHGIFNRLTQAADDTRIPMCGPSLIWNAVDARVLDRERSGYCIDFRALAVGVFRPTVHRQFRATSLVTQVVDETPGYVAFIHFEIAWPMSRFPASSS